MRNSIQSSYFALVLSVLILAGCSLDRDPGLQQSVQLDLQGLVFDDVGATAYSAFEAHPCVVFRFCGEQVGCNETSPKEMDFNDGIFIDSGFVSFDIPLAVGRRYRFQMLGYPKNGNSCEKVGTNPIQMGLSGASKIKSIVNVFKVSPDYKASGDFDKIERP